ncbi:PAS domain-containing protein, partial [Gaiella sp.]
MWPNREASRRAPSTSLLSIDDDGRRPPLRAVDRIVAPAQETRFQTISRHLDLLERLPLVVYIDELTAGSANIYTSPQTTTILGYTPDDWASDPGFFPSILHPDDRDRVLAEHARTHTSGEPLRTEYRLVRRDGREVWVRDEAVLVRDKDGRAQCLQGYLVDISDAKVREAAVYATEARARAILESALDCIITIDHEGTIVEFNPAAE